MTDLVCSAKGCRGTAVWAVRWNNPTIHTAGAAQGLAGLRRPPPAPRAPPRGPRVLARHDRRWTSSPRPTGERARPPRDRDARRRGPGVHRLRPARAVAVAPVRARQRGGRHRAGQLRRRAGALWPVAASPAARPPETEVWQPVTVDRPLPAATRRCCCATGRSTASADSTSWPPSRGRRRARRAGRGGRPRLADRHRRGRGRARSAADADGHRRARRTGQRRRGPDHARRPRRPGPGHRPGRRARRGGRRRWAAPSLDAYLQASDRERLRARGTWGRSSCRAPTSARTCPTRSSGGSSRPGRSSVRSSCCAARATPVRATTTSWHRRARGGRPARRAGRGRQSRRAARRGLARTRPRR